MNIKERSLLDIPLYIQSSATKVQSAKKLIETSPLEELKSKIEPIDKGF